jgi:PAS domain S-box-containing protein
LSGSLVRDESKAPVSYIFYAQEIPPASGAVPAVATPLEQALRASEEKFRTLVEHLPALVYVLANDERQTPLYYSPYLETLTGERPEEALALAVHWLEQVHPEDRARIEAEETRTAASGELFQAEYRLLRRDGSYVWVRDECVPVRDATGQIVAWQGVLLDVSERIQAEEDVRRALEAAQAANRAKGLFLDMMSHELRTPLQAVLGYAEFLLAGGPGALSAEQVEDVGYIQQGGQRMLTLINQMLDLSRMEAGRLEITTHPVDLDPILEQVRQDVAPQAAQKGLGLRIEVRAPLPLALGDAERLRQVLLNLVGNAVKFTERGEVHISARATRFGVEVAVRDTGIGIAPRDLSRVFEEFRQVDGSLTRRQGGAGLGLAIAQKLMVLMGGDLTVESQVGYGSTFTIHLQACA